MQPKQRIRISSYDYMDMCPSGKELHPGRRYDFRPESTHDKQGLLASGVIKPARLSI